MMKLLCLTLTAIWIVFCILNFEMLVSHCGNFQNNIIYIEYNGKSAIETTSLVCLLRSKPEGIAHLTKVLNGPLFRVHQAYRTSDDAINESHK